MNEWTKSTRLRNDVLMFLFSIFSLLFQFIFYHFHPLSYQRTLHIEIPEIGNFLIYILLQIELIIRFNFIYFSSFSLFFLIDGW